MQRLSISSKPYAYLCKEVVEGVMPVQMQGLRGHAGACICENSAPAETINCTRLQDRDSTARLISGSK